MSANETHADSGFRITGWHVLISLILFFGAVMVVNGFMMWAALSTFDGVETPSSYKAGLEFSNEMERAAAQDALGWSVTAHVDGTAEARTLALTAADRTGNALDGLAATAVFRHPVDGRQDRSVPLYETALGNYEGTVPVPAGAWTLAVELSDGDQVVFRSRNRISVR